MFRFLLFCVSFSCISPLMGEIATIIQKKQSDITVNVQSIDNKLVFDWPLDLMCCLAKVDDHWWIIFDSSAQEFNLPKSRDLPRGIVDINPFFDLISSSDVTVFKLKLREGYEISVQKEKKKWGLEIVELGKQKNIIESRINSQSAFEKIKQYNIIHHLKSKIKKWPNYNITNLLGIKEVVLENIISNKTYTFILTNTIDHGVEAFFETPYYGVIPSRQGISFLHYSDALILSKSDNEINLTVLNAPEEIPLSKATDHKSTAYDFQVSIFKPISKKDLEEQLKNIKEKKQKEIDPFILIEEAGVSLMMGNQLACMSFVNLVLYSYPALEHHPFIRSMKAASYLLNQTFSKAKESVFGLPNTLEVQILRAIILSTVGLPQSEVKSLNKLLILLKDYNNDIVDEFLSQAFIACLNAGEYETILKLLEGVSIPEKSYFKIFYKYAQLIAHMYSEKDIPKSSDLLNLLKKESWELIPPQIKAYILYDVALLELNEKKITSDEFIKKLTDLHFLWRGDYFELKLLEKIVDTYIEKHDYLNAILYLEKIKNNFKEFFDVLHIDKKMEICFNNFFKEKMYEKASPLKVIGFFELYKDYTPETKEGEEITKVVGNILMQLDLLDQAAELLSKQAMHEKDEKNLSALYLSIAKIHLGNNNGEAALSVLDNIPESQVALLKNEIVDLKTKAYVVMDKIDNALQVLEEHNTLMSMKNAADLLIDQKQWVKARHKLSDMLMRFESEKDDDLKMECLISLATLNILLEEDYENEALRIAYDAFIKSQSKDKQERFGYFVDDIQIGKINRSVVDEQLSSIQKIKKIKDYFLSGNASK